MSSVRGAGAPPSVELPRLARTEQSEGSLATPMTDRGSHAATKTTPILRNGWKLCKPDALESGREVLNITPGRDTLSHASPPAIGPAPDDSFQDNNRIRHGHALCP